MPLCPPHDWIQVQPIMWLTLVSKNISVGSLHVFVGFTQSLSCWLTGTDDHILKRQTWFDDSPFQLFNFYIRKVDHIERWTDRLENTKQILADMHTMCTQYAHNVLTICTNAMCTQYAHMWDNKPRWLRPGNQSGLETYSPLYQSQWIMPRDELTCRYAWKTLSPDGRLAINADWTSCAGNHCNPPKGNQLDEDTHWTHTGWTLDTHWTHTGPRCLDHPEPGLDRPFLEARRLKAIQTDLKIQRAACLVETPDAGNRYKNKKVKSFECPSLAKLDCPDEATKSFAIQWKNSCSCLTDFNWRWNWQSFMLNWRWGCEIASLRETRSHYWHWQGHSSARFQWWRRRLFMAT